jgi:CheY-like chemotaxis protein
VRTPKFDAVATPATARAVKPVLIVDDNADIREALSTLLEIRGFTTMCADNGATALWISSEAITSSPA